MEDQALVEGSVVFKDEEGPAGDSREPRPGPQARLPAPPTAGQARSPQCGCPPCTVPQPAARKKRPAHARWQAQECAPRPATPWLPCPLCRGRPFRLTDRVKEHAGPGVPETDTSGRRTPPVPMGRLHGPG